MLELFHDGPNATTLRAIAAGWWFEDDEWGGWWCRKLRANDPAHENFFYDILDAKGFCTDLEVCTRTPEFALQFDTVGQNERNNHQYFNLASTMGGLNE